MNIWRKIEFRSSRSNVLFLEESPMGKILQLRMIEENYKVVLLYFKYMNLNCVEYDMMFFIDDISDFVQSSWRKYTL